MFSRIINKIPFFRKKSPWELYKNNIIINPTTILMEHAHLRVPPSVKPMTFRLEIGERSLIDAIFIFERPEARITIGSGCQLGMVTLNCAGSIEIGNNVLMAWGITIMDHNAHSFDLKHRIEDIGLLYDATKTGDMKKLLLKNWDMVKIESIKICDNVWIGFDSAILKGVTIGENSIIGARSVVTGDIPSNCVAAGNPCRIIRNV
jgi:galactoside O-acetyltransferase